MKTSYTCADARCPKCREQLTGASNPFGTASPEADDLTVCAYCSAVLVFNNDLTLREAKAEDIATLEPEVATKLGMVVGATHLRLKDERERDGTH